MHRKQACYSANWLHEVYLSWIKALARQSLLPKPLPDRNVMYRQLLARNACLFGQVCLWPLPSRASALSCQTTPDRRRLNVGDHRAWPACPETRSAWRAVCRAAPAACTWRIFSTVAEGLIDAPGPRRCNQHIRGAKFLTALPGGRR